MSEVDLSKPLIDYSQWSLFDKCEWAWYERYIKQFARKPKGDFENNNALTLGTLVHAGLEHYRSKGTPDIPTGVIRTANASYNCVEQANFLLGGYILRYPKENFKLFGVEQAIRFDLQCGVNGLAKVDNYFHVDTPTKMESGLGFGDAAAPPDFVLEPGWWIREYKTKDEGRNRGNWITAWRMAMQANFQMLALQQHLGERVQGMLVDVLEKPKPYEPKHTCKHCKTISKREHWVPDGSFYKCPCCEHLQMLDTSNKSKVERKPSYYRIRVSRTPAVLEKARGEIREVALRMAELRRGPLPGDATPPLPARSTDKCVDSIFGECEYFAAHAEDVEASALPGNFVPIEALAYISETYADGLPEDV